MDTGILCNSPCCDKGIKGNLGNFEETNGRREVILNFYFDFN